jgi:hypothetical protein
LLGEQPGLADACMSERPPFRRQGKQKAMPTAAR